MVEWVEWVEWVFLFHLFHLFYLLPFHPILLTSSFISPVYFSMSAKIVINFILLRYKPHCGAHLFVINSAPHFDLCLVLFVSNDFVYCFFLFCRSKQLLYNTTPSAFCQHLFYYQLFTLVMMSPAVVRCSVRQLYYYITKAAIISTR